MIILIHHYRMENYLELTEMFFCGVIRICDALPNQTIQLC